MTTYAWPGFGVNRFQLSLMANTRLFTAPYAPTTQVLDFLGERWAIALTLTPTTDPVQAAAREAFFDRLKGPANTTALWHLRLPAPQGSISLGSVPVPVYTGASAVTVTGSAGTVTVVAGSPTLGAEVPQLSNTCTVYTRPGRQALAGDMLGIGGQLVRVMADATADAGGAMLLEVQPRARSVWSAGQPVQTAAPTANFMLKADGAPTAWAPGYAEGVSVEFIEKV